MTRGDYTKYIDDASRAIVAWDLVWNGLTCSQHLKSCLKMMEKYLRLYVNAFAFQAVLYRASTSGTQEVSKSACFPHSAMASPDARHVYEAVDAAEALLRIAIEDIDAEKYLRYMPARFYLYEIHSSVFLYKAHASGAVSSGKHAQTANLMRRFIGVLEIAATDADHIAAKYAKLLNGLWFHRSDSSADATRKRNSGSNVHSDEFQEVNAVQTYSNEVDDADSNHLPSFDEIGLQPLDWIESYLTDNHGFLKRAAEALKKSNIVKFNLGPVPVYLVSGSQNVQRLFRNSTGSTQLSSDKFVLMVTEKVHGVDQQDAKRWASDKTGRLKIPAPGTEDTPEDQRIWSGMHHIFTEHLSRAEPTAKLAQNFTAFFGAKLEKQPLNEWKEVCLFQFLKKDMAEAAIMTLAGRRLIDKYPEFVDAMWEYDKVAMKLMYGLPTWMNPGPRKAQKKALDMMETFLQDAWDTFDWDGMEAEADWEPTFGSRLQREHAKFWKDKKFSMRSRAAQHLGIQSGFNVNSIPQTAWVVMELAKNPSLWRAVKEEVQGAILPDPVTSKPAIDVTKLLALPLLQSVYAETLRLHVSINVTREVMEPIEWDGYVLPKGSLVQAPTQIGLQDESVWGVEGHSASSFWAERHIKYVDKEDDLGHVKTTMEFSMAGRPSDYFPYGGGVSMCPGRFFAKQEIMLVAAMIVSRFEIEFIEWVTFDGVSSDRPAEDEKSAIGSGAVSPDRDMKVRWRRTQ
ncbi:Cholesterol 7-alpha-monooxygenase [Colletotrichum sp. SAR 10_70]|nr:Cholesterol 7-alpha-monooxygenase [Colletotrichum sp. SAR 10_71]KAI8172861.1 Cholesterol 7-alpha-monooxygenase [Colletotrichum sp. SAR 10_75]KAI8196927.1 Cholesterol 7-alpha-monooxygenase [Colletotrichum sp. SAR 10_76]KAI8204809.1 Cholesterol 7-alpha-monooxygenase [Colletotrichum sp. SAR 10_70]KAJ4995096.1 Cholesterol 7-alpha-monooxygenase [Colletotrichum sp. SAR 10_66]